MKTSISLALLVVASAFASSARAQVPSAARSDQPAAPTTARATTTRSYDYPSYSELYSPAGRSPLRRTMPYGDDNSTWGYRNPGGVGRMNEYYPPSNQFQNENATTHVAKFDQGPAGTQRSAQLQAEQMGIQRYNSLQSHIDRYGSPVRFGFGYGFGGYGF